MQNHQIFANTCKHNFGGATASLVSSRSSWGATGILTGVPRSPRRPIADRIFSGGRCVDLRAPFRKKTKPVIVENYCTI